MPSSPAFVASPNFRPDDDPANPSLIEPYPPTLAVEIALRIAPVPTICKAYDIDHNEWNRIRNNPIFVEDLRKCLEELKKDGMNFRLRAQLQANELLKTSWNMIHDTSGQVPPAVRGKMIENTMRWAGYDKKEDGNAAPQNALQINIHM